MAAESIGALYSTKIPGYADNADIQAAFKLYHYGSTEYNTANANTANLVSPSIAYTLNDLQVQITNLDPAGSVSKSIIDAKGDILVGSANDAVDNLTVGSNNYVLTADSSQTLGIKWASPSVSPTNSVTLTNKTLTSPSITAPSITGKTSIEQILEKITVSATAATGTINYNLVANSAILYYTTEASGNWTLNVRGDGSTTLNSLMSIGQTLTIAFLVTNGATPYYQTGFQIDGNAVTPKWQGLPPVEGNASSLDVYTVTVIKTANATFTALIAQTKFA
jgi:hypothetical protein